MEARKRENPEFPVRVEERVRKVGGPAAGGTSSAARRAYARQVNSVHIPDKKLKADNTISFSDVDLNDVILPHNETLVITMLIANFETPRILVDNGSSADILYYHTFKQLGIKDDLLKPSSTELYGFAGEIVKVVGSIELPVLMGSALPRATAMVEFLVVNTPSVYNAILGRPGQNLLKAIPLAYHQKMKFITPRGLGKVKGDQIRSRE
ncbi:uncharacterized protein LOC143861381 [Tasmannia lanceolata]|uniref:uncharacterized protein LOC143861381 n=1 Tax=Tasmannia lanceolata TaxID=3420 RepID=UPI004064219F